MESEEGEAYRFYEAVMTEGPAEEWMTALDEAMKASLYGIAKEGVFMYGCKPRSVHNRECMVERRYFDLVGVPSRSPQRIE